MARGRVVQPSLGDVDRVLHAVAQKANSSVQCRLSSSDSPLSAVARQVPQFL